MDTPQDTAEPICQGGGTSMKTYLGKERKHQEKKLMQPEQLEANCSGTGNTPVGTVAHG